QGRFAVAKNVVGKADARAEIELGGAENAAGYAAMAVVNYSVELIGRRPCGGQRRAVRSLHEQAVGLYRRRFGRVPAPGVEVGGEIPVHGGIGEIGFAQAQVQGEFLGDSPVILEVGFELPVVHVAS